MAEHLVIPSTARAEDGVFLAMADVAELAAATDAEYRIIGAHMVSVQPFEEGMARFCVPQ